VGKVARHETNELSAAGEDIATATELAEEWDPSAEPPTKYARFALSGVKHPTISNSSGPATAGKATRRTAVFHGSNTELKPLALGNERSMRKLRFQFLFAVGCDIECDTLSCFSD
jgi:hypothetical protein